MSFFATCLPPLSGSYILYALKYSPALEGVIQLSHTVLSTPLSLDFRVYLVAVIYNVSPRNLVQVIRLDKKCLYFCQPLFLIILAVSIVNLYFGVVLAVLGYVLCVS